MSFNEAMLRVTSLLFATVVAHAYHARVASYHHLFLVVTVLSVLFHATKDRRVGIVDKFVAHCGFVFVLGDSQRAARSGQGWLLIYPLTVLCLWFAQSWLPARAERLHACLHCVAVVGLHCFLFWLY